MGVDAGPDRYDWELPTPVARVDSRDPVRIALAVDGDERDGSVTIVVDDSVAVRSIEVDR